MKRIIFAFVLLTVAGMDLKAQTAATFHVFPQLADGLLADGTFYVSTILATNVNAQPATCSLRFSSDLSGRLFGATTFTLPVSGSFGLQATLAAFGRLFPLVTGYATMSCDRAVTALVGYLLFSPSGTLLSGATVFSSPPTTRAQLLVNQTGGTRLAVALVNDTDNSAQYQLTLLSAIGQPVGTTTINVPARSNAPKFVDELIPTPDNFLGSVSITSSSSPFSVIGLFFAGSVFFSQPATSFGQ